jgi:hypothetical protein
MAAQTHHSDQLIPNSYLCNNVQAQKAKLMSELKSMLARYLKPINRQLDDIYIRVAKMEKQIQQI